MGRRYRGGARAGGGPHGCARPNVLWCEETQKVMLIDFERSITVRGSNDPDPVRAKAVQFHIEEDLGAAKIIIEPPPLSPCAYREYYM